MRALFPLLLAGAVVSAHASAQEVDWQRLDETFARKPAVSGDVHRYGFPRTDLSVTLDGVTIRPALALGGWVAFKPAHGGVMVMGDLVLLETEINPVMAKLIEGGLEITAVHNHLLRANPATFYMHVGGHGDRKWNVDCSRRADGIGDRNQFPADWRRESRHYRRLYLGWE